MPHQPTVEDLLSRLVAVDSTSSRSNLPLLEVLAEVVDGAGAEARIAVTEGSETGTEKGNLLARVGPVGPAEGSGGGDRDRGLVLCGHSDTVPAGEPDWESDPFTLTAYEDRWVGRGTADMKGFLALACARLLAWRERDLEAPLALLVTHDEEVGSLGAERFAASELAATLPRAMIIGEPTELQIHRLHKGHLRLTLTVRGKAGHSGYPEKGINAVTEAARVVTALEDLALALRTEIGAEGEAFGEVPYTVLHPATIDGGEAINVIAASCRVEVGIRLLPGADAEEVIERVRAAATGATEQPVDVEVGRFSPPMSTAADAPVVRALMRASGDAAERGVHFSSDGGFLSRAGFDCVLYGPGSIRVAHRANEFLPRADVEVVRGVLDGVIAELCGGGP